MEPDKVSIFLPIQVTRNIAIYVFKDTWFLNSWCHPYPANHVQTCVQTYLEMTANENKCHVPVQQLDQFSSNDSSSRPTSTGSRFTNYRKNQLRVVAGWHSEVVKSILNKPSINVQSGEWNLSIWIQRKFG